MAHLFLHLIFFGLIANTKLAKAQGENEGENFSPTVTAVCQQFSNKMVISVTTSEPFYGLVISRNLRNNTNCYVEGTGRTLTTLTLNMIASINDQDYCQVSTNHKTSEKTVQIAVRQNRALELAEDKLYLVSCGKYDSAPPATSTGTRMGVYDSSNAEFKEVIKTHAYKLKIKSNQKFFRIRNCFAFSSVDNQVPLFDHDGCPESKVMSKWSYYGQEAESTIYSMFRFQDSKQLSFQCHVLFCSNKESCPNPTCSETPAAYFYSPQQSELQTNPASLIGSNDTDAISSTTVTVLDPGDKVLPASFSEEVPCTGICPKWLLWLAIILGVLFLLMLLVNLFLCTALTCTCTRTELIEKDPSIMEDYDPYRSSWAGSQYGNSRYSINQPINNKYSDSAGGLSDHYATPQIITSRPPSRFSSKN